MKRQTIMALGGLLVAALALAVACTGAFDLAVETTPGPEATPTVLPSPTPSPTQVPAGAFQHTDAWFAAHGDEYPTDEQMGQLADAFAADVMASHRFASCRRSPKESRSNSNVIKLRMSQTSEVSKVLYPTAFDAVPG